MKTVPTGKTASGSQVAPGNASPAWRRKFAAYLSLTKPRVVELLLVTTVPTMIFAAKGFPSFWLIAATLIGGAAAAGSAGAFNCYIDRDIDKLMHRTEKRPLVTGELTPRQALIFSWSMGVFSVLWLAAFVNLLSAVLGAVAIFFYVVVYTLWLKRRTPQNIIWGGAAGCMPVLIGWAAVSNSLSWAAVILFMVIFLWTPPHYWPLSMRYKEDYANANVPMLAVVRSANAVSVQVVLYAWAMVACSLLLIPIGHAGWVYSIAAVLAGAWFLAESHRLHNEARRDETSRPNAMRVFHGSITYLTVLFLALAVDPFVHF